MDKYRLVEEKYIGAQGFIDDSKMTGDSRPDGSDLDTESTVRITQQHSQPVNLALPVPRWRTCLRFVVKS